MSVGYKAIQWNRQKIIYDVILLTTVGLYLWGFMALTQHLGTDLDVRGVRIRAYGSAAFVLLHVILSIGPLSRLSPKFLPLLFNRRHMGVTMFFLALIHVAGLKLSDSLEAIGIELSRFPWEFDGALTWYHDFGNLDPLVSLFVSNSHYGDFILFPFEFLGAGALSILFLMAATSHDFWLANLTAPVWKALHMGVYLAYGLLVGHVVLGALQTNKHPALALMVFAGMVWIVGLHLVAGYREVQRDKMTLPAAVDGFVEVGRISEIPESRAKIVTIASERVAIFKYDGKISAVSNVCQHQNGPLGEGKIVDGCITCPWHGYQYLPDCGASPPPFHERIPTFDVRLEGDRIFVSTMPNRAGTRVEPAIIS
ncbi:ferric reductase-like transmembrane domain-containing protein [Oscillatoriales cyanobacterium LEGE 11467]|uniref:Ferric reductase-like transmembrane domain-containing protein n=1 Tax=Zarconia navalis LEGE 11467 TaxID=1828826 RepID=A0A928VYY3_9CYAN|nr:Rieske 2Fe-2S domain-containing protein [Zarconia navalis]MBE9040861.1 ferric reductase-like transmembrane domain-containing protein [Zarconia navalis LEGE 11467]